jgi:hypothetical protein
LKAKVGADNIVANYKETVMNMGIKYEKGATKIIFGFDVAGSGGDLLTGFNRRGNELSVI